MANDERADRITVLGKVSRALEKLPTEDRLAVLKFIAESEGYTLSKKAVG